VGNHSISVLFFKSLTGGWEEAVSVKSIKIHHVKLGRFFATPDRMHLRGVCLASNTGYASTHFSSHLVSSLYIWPRQGGGTVLVTFRFREVLFSQTLLLR